MFNDDSNRQQSQGQSQGLGGGFARRPIPKYGNGGDKPLYQGASGAESGYNGGSGGYGTGGGVRQYGDRQQSYSPRPPQRRNADGSGGYNNYGGGGYKSGGYGGGYNRNSSYNQNDRLVRQNDIIIKLLKDIISRLPAPQGGVSGDVSSDGYGAEGSYSNAGSYSGSSSYAGSGSGSAAGSYAGSDDETFDVSGNGQEVASDRAGDSADQDNYEDKDEYNS